MDAGGPSLAAGGRAPCAHCSCPSSRVRRPCRVTRCRQLTAHVPDGRHGGADRLGRGQRPGTEHVRATAAVSGVSAADPNGPPARRRSTVWTICTVSPRCIGALVHRCIGASAGPAAGRNASAGTRYRNRAGDSCRPYSESGALADASRCTRDQEGHAGSLPRRPPAHTRHSGIRWNGRTSRCPDVETSGVHSIGSPRCAVRCAVRRASSALLPRHCRHWPTATSTGFVARRRPARAGGSCLGCSSGGVCGDGDPVDDQGVLPQ